MILIKTQFNANGIPDEYWERSAIDIKKMEIMRGITNELEKQIDQHITEEPKKIFNVQLVLLGPEEFRAIKLEHKKMLVLNSLCQKDKPTKKSIDKFLHKWIDNINYPATKSNRSLMEDDLYSLFEENDTKA